MEDLPNSAAFSIRQPIFFNFSLTGPYGGVILVNTMNNNDEKSTDGLLDYQSAKFQDLMVGLVDCCHERTAYISGKFGIPEAEVRCLMLFEGQRYLTPKGIAQRLDVSKSRATKIINGLIEKRLAERTDDARDGRVKLISLTKKGRKVTDQIDTVSRDLHQKVLLELESEQRKTALSSLELLRSSMEAVKEQLV